MIGRARLIGWYLSAWRAKNSRSRLQGTPTLSRIDREIHIKNDVFDIVVSIAELARMSKRITARA